MSAERAYRIDMEQDDIVVRVRRDVLGADEVSRFLDYLELEAIARRSDLGEEDAASLAREIDRAVWQHARSRVPGDV
jgi:hypothetical protein